MERALVFRIVTNQEFSTPNCAVRAVASAVKSCPDDRLIGGEPVFRHASRDVGVMVLDPDGLQAFFLPALARITGSQVIGMQVVGQQLGLDAEELLDMGDPVPKGLQGLVIFQVADVMAEEGVVLTGEAKGVFQLPASRQDGGGLPGQVHRVGGIAARAPQGNELGLAAAGEGTHHGVVTAGVDVAVVHQESICEGSEALPRFLVMGGNGLLAEVAAGHHQGGRETLLFFEQQVMQGGVGEHHAEGVLAGSNLRHNFRSRQALQDDNRALFGGEQFRFNIAHGAEPAGGFKVRHHDGKGFFDAQFPFAQGGHCLRVGGITGQVEAPEAFDRQGSPVFEQLARLPDGSFFFLRSFSVYFQPDMRAAGGAGDRLGMEAAVQRVVVFVMAVGAHLEGSHSGLRSVVGDVFDDGEARAAVGAVDEGVAVTAVGGVEELAQAVRADAVIWGDGLEGAGDGFGV